MKRSGAFESYVYRNFRTVAVCILAIVVLTILYLR
jgi:hypothetical protein